MPEKKIFILIIGGMLSFVNVQSRARVKRIGKDIEETKNKSNLIGKKYLSRFERRYRKLNDVEKNIIHKIYKLTVSQLEDSEIKEGKENSIIIKYSGETEINGFFRDERIKDTRKLYYCFICKVKVFS